MSKLISFVYSGGHNPGQKRFLLVDGENSTTVEGLDLDKGEFRRFSRSKMSSVECYDSLVLTGDASVHLDLGLLLTGKGYTVKICGDKVIGFKPIKVVYRGAFSVKVGSDCVAFSASCYGDVSIAKNGKLLPASLDGMIQALQSLKQ